MSWLRARYLVSVCLPSPGMISSLTPACAQLAWIACAMSMIGEVERVSIVTVKPFGYPALASKALAFAGSTDLLEEDAGAEGVGPAERPAEEGREAQAEDRADVPVPGGAEDPFAEAADRLVHHLD